MCHKGTENQIETVMKDWLRYAADRDGGRKKREQIRKQKQDLDSQRQFITEAQNLE